MKLYTGVVVSTKMNLTAVVEVAREWTHPIYKKTVKRTKKYPVHDPQKQAVVGDIVTFTDSVPISKTKTFVLHQVVKSAPSTSLASNKTSSKPNHSK